MLGQILTAGGNQVNDKQIVISMSLLMRMFEWCHEEAKNDVAMHKAMEKIVAFNDGTNPLTIDTYEVIVAEANDGQEDDVALDDDMQSAYDLGAEQAENGEELSSDGRDYSAVAGEIISDDKDNGCGASNNELEQFWNGYNDIVGKTHVITLNADNETDSCETPCEQELDQSILGQIEEIINLGKC